jgi:SPP1 family phage portal protein
MNIEQYKLTFDNPNKWFVEEVQKGYHTNRIAEVHNNRNYLTGDHKILLKEDAVYKGKTLVTRKTILQYVKTVLNFHATYLLGKAVNLTGDEEIKKTFTDIYKLGLYKTVDYEILDRVNKYGDAYEYVYYDNGIIKSKVFDSADCYPVYDDFGNYVSFVEHWTDIYSSISYWNVYYPTYVEHWTNEGGNELLVDTQINVSGLPIHYHNFNEGDYNYGVSILVDIKPLLDELEDILSKLGDAIYVNSLNPMPVAIGQHLENTIPADAQGFVLNLDNGSDYKVVSTQMDYNTIKLYLDNVKEMINQIGCVPSVLGNSNVANVSEVSLKMLFHMANIKAMETEKWLEIGFQDRFKKFKQLLQMQGIDVKGEVGIEYNLSIPVSTDEVVKNLKTMQEMGAISKETIMEKSGIIKDNSVEKSRLNSENPVVENV